MNNLLPDLRNEIKIVSNNEYYNFFLNIFLENGFIKSYPRRQVHSLYYDNEIFKCVKDNLSGITPRSKYRFRWYSLEEEFQGLRFERKLRISEKNTKFIYKVKKLSSTKEFFENVRRKKLREMINHKNKIKLINNLKPVLLVNYTRDYLEMKTGERLTIDNKIGFKNYSNSDNFLRKSFHRDNNLIIFELKFGDENSLSKLFKVLPSGSSRCSKYLFGHSILNNFSYI